LLFLFALIAVLCCDSPHLKILRSSTALHEDNFKHLLFTSSFPVQKDGQSTFTIDQRDEQTMFDFIFEYQTTRDFAPDAHEASITVQVSDREIDESSAAYLLSDPA
jgi:hypothetical protein